MVNTYQDKYNVKAWCIEQSIAKAMKDNEILSMDFSIDYRTFTMEMTFDKNNKGKICFDILEKGHTTKRRITIDPLFSDPIGFVAKIYGIAKMFWYNATDEDCEHFDKFDDNKNWYVELTSGEKIPWPVFFPTPVYSRRLQSVLDQDSGKFCYDFTTNELTKVANVIVRIEETPLKKPQLILIKE